MPSRARRAQHLRHARATAEMFSMAMRHLTRWPSEQAEMLDLLDIVQRNCLCPAQASVSGTHHGVCAAHELLLSDQQAINRLAFVRSIADRLRAQEWSES